MIMNFIIWNIGFFFMVSICLYLDHLRIGVTATSDNVTSFLGVLYILGNVLIFVVR